MNLSTQWGLWTVIALSVVWPVERLLSSVSSDLVSGWWEASFVLAREIVTHKDRSIEEPVNVTLICAETGTVGASVLPHRVLVVIKQLDTTSRALLVDARTGELWPADLDWNITGSAMSLTIPDVAAGLKENIKRKGLWSDVEDEVLLQHATFIFNFISSLKALKLDPMSSHSPWPHPTVFNQPLLESGNAHSVSSQQETWLVGAAWLISGVIWLSGGHLIWLRFG